MNKKLWLIIVVLGMIIGCNQGTKDNNTTGKMKNKKSGITVSILPQRYFVERIAGDTFDINVMIPPGHNPATYEPTPQELKAVSESHLYLRIGHIAFEKAWMSKIASLNNDMKVIDTSKGVSLISGMVPHSHENESQEEKDHLNNDHDNHQAKHDHQGHQHDQSGIDPHIWLSPTAVEIISGNILEALIEADPTHKNIFEKNHAAFISDIHKLQEENRSILTHLKGKKFMVFHPAWSYFAREYGLVQFSIETEGKNPGPAGLKKMIDLAKHENIRVIFVQSQFDSSSAETVASEINGRVIAMDPLSPDWLNNMKKIASTFKETLGEE